MRRLAAVLILGVGALLLTPGAPGVPDVPGDPTPPVVTPVITGTLGSNGWYITNVTVNWTIVDPESTILSTSGCNAITLTANTSGTQLTCSAESDGGTTTVSKTFKLDKTAPAATASPSRAADANGWYNHELTVDFAGSDGTSGVESCSPPQTYAGPDSPGTPVLGTCRDRAGNTAPASVVVKYDETSPAATPSARLPDANGWHNHAVTVTFQGADATSGIESCSQMTYAGPDDPSVALSGVCRDRAGNESGSSVFTLKYDETEPAATATASRTPDVNGWYTGPLTVSFAGSDVTSGLESCDVPKTYAGPDAVSTSVAGACRDQAGNVASPSVSLKYDASAPQVAATPERGANALGWYTTPLVVSFSGSDPTSGLAACDPAKSYSAPDSSDAVVTGSCRDNAGNSASGSFVLRYDATAPQATATPSRQPNANSWYNAPLSISFTGSDATAGIDSCDAAKSYSGPDTAAASVAGFCRDRAGNQSPPSSYGFKYDATAPAVTATRDRPPNANGWYTAPLSIHFTGGDALSGLESCDGPQSYPGPDTPSVSIGGGCRDRAGNVGSASVAIKYDATAPQATATPSRHPNPNGWYNAAVSVAFSWTDGTSGTGSCETAKSYSGPDNSSASLSAVCQDLAGNVKEAPFPLRYDATAPTTTATPGRTANANGWYNAPLAVGFTGTDQTSGVDSCDAATIYSSPDSGAASISGSCGDRAGNTATGAFAFKYDATPPVVTQAVAVRPPDQAGWYNRPVAFAVQGTDATSGLDSCPPASYAGPDSAEASFSGACLDLAGNQGTTSFPLRYDATGPQVAASPSRGADVNGWYNHALAVSFAGTDSVSGLESCAAPESYGGPDSGAAVIGGICSDKAGNVGVGSLGLRYDATPPQVAGAIPNRPPDANGWYSRPLVVGFHGTDATSEIEACTETRYAGPDTGAASVTGSCHDRAGNSSSPASFALRYDATAPSLTGATVKAGNHTAVLSWTASPDTALVEIRRSGALVYRGLGRSFTDKRLKNGTRYRYTLTGYDEARNAATRTLDARPTAQLLAPPAGATVSAPPRLAWRADDKATYYNVQVWRRGKIFSAWPTGTSVRLPRAWTFAGRRHRLAPGRYRWYVWPGYGRRAKNAFGPLLGSSSFVVR